MYLSLIGCQLVQVFIIMAGFISISFETASKGVQKCLCKFIYASLRPFFLQESRYMLSRYVSISCKRALSRMF